MGLFSGLKKSFAESQLLETVDEKQIRSLLEKGVDPNCQDKKGWTPLLKKLNVNPLSKPKVEPSGLARLLIDGGADIYHENGEHICAFVVTAFRDEPKTMKVLLEGPADTPKKANHRAAALSLASGMSHLEIVNLLLEAGTPANQNDGQTEIMELLLHGIPAELVTSLVEGTRFMEKTKDGRSLINMCRWQWPPLHRAVFAGHAETVKALLDAGANPNFVASDGKTPMGVLTEYTPDEAVRELLTAAGATD